MGRQKDKSDQIYNQKEEKTKKLIFRSYKVSTCILHVSGGIRQTKHPVKVGRQEAVPTLLVPDQLLTVMKTVDNRHH